MEDLTEKVALVHDHFWNAFFVLSRQYFETDTGIIYISCAVFQYDPRRQVSYVLIITDFFNNMKYSIDDLCVQDDLKKLFEREAEVLVQKHIHQGKACVQFSHKLKDIGIETHLYPKHVAFYKFKRPGENHEVIVLIPTSNDDVSCLLTRMELRPDQNIDLSQIQVLSIDDIIPEQQIIFCLRELNHHFQGENS